MKKSYVLILILSLLSAKVNAGTINTDSGSSNLKNSSDKNSGSLDLFNLDIFSLSKKREDAFDAPSSIYVITSEDIRRSGATNIPEALRLAPGIQVARVNNYTWSISARGFNGQFSNKLLVMIDGRTIYTHLFSGVFWHTHDYVLEDIERIEVIKGPGGTIWGSNAVNGIINIITKDSILTQGGHTSVIAGNEDRLITEARYGGKTKNKNHYRVYAKEGIRDESKIISSGAGNGDNFKMGRGGFRYDIRSIKDNKISIYGDVQSSKSNNYFNSSTTNAKNGKPDHFYSKTGNFSINWSKTLSEKSNFTLNSYFDYNQFDMNVLRFISRTSDIDFQYFYNFNEKNQFIWGLGYRLINDTIGESLLASNIKLFDYNQNGKNDEIFSTFFQDKITLKENKLYLTLGSKFENNAYTGFEYQPSARLAFYPTDNQTIWTSISRAVRIPTRGEEGVNTLNGYQLGQISYDSEQLVAFEVGYRAKPTSKTFFDISAYLNNYEKLQTFEGSSPSMVYNLGYGKTYGFEVNYKWQIIDNWYLEASYDFIEMKTTTKANSTDTTSANSYNNSTPKNQFRLRSNYNITSKVEFDNYLYYVDSISNSPGNYKAPAYIRLDTRIGYLPNEKLEFSLVGQNLIDKKHTEFGPTLNNQIEIGRAFYLKAVIKF